jgi:tetratricopeptide (TPR) repeat protein
MFLRTRKICSVLAICLALACQSAAFAEKQQPDSKDEASLVWTKLMQQADDSFAANSYGQAERQYQLALLQAEKFGTSDVRLSKTLHSLASLAIARGQFAKAEPLLERELRAKEKALGGESSEVVTTVGKLAQFYLVHGTATRADRLVTLLFSFVERRLKEQQSIKDTLAHLEKYYAKSGDYSAARTDLKRLEDTTRTSTANQDLELATTLDALGHLYQEKDTLTVAEQAYREALNLRETALSPGHLALAYSYENLANLYLAQGKTDAAEPLLKKSLALTEKTLQPQRPEVYTRLDELAKTMIALGQTREAESLYKRAISLMETAGNSNGNAVGQAAYALSVLYLKGGRSGEAVPLLKRALKIAEAVNGPQHIALLPILDSYADALERVNRGGDAGKMRARARQIRGISMAQPENPANDF